MNASRVPSIRVSPKTAELSRRWGLRAFKLAVVVAVVWGIWRTVASGIDEISRRPLTLDFSWLAAAGGLYLAGTLPCWLFWHRVLVVLGQRPRPLASLTAFFVGHLGKYVPGKAMVVVLRAGLVRGPAVDAGAAAIAVFYETLTMMAVGAFLGAAVLAFWLRTSWLYVIVALALMAASGLPTLPFVFRRIVRLIGRGRWTRVAVERCGDLAIPTVLFGWAANVVGWLLLALSLWATIRGFEGWPTDLARDYPRYLAAVCLSVVAGFLSMIPGGAGVRELVLMEVLAPAIGRLPALTAAVALRLVSLVVESFVSVILYLVSAVRPREGEAPAEPHE